MPRLGPSLFRFAVICAVLAGAVASGAEPVAGSSHFPLGRGRTWKYLVTVNVDGVADKPFFQTVVAEEPTEVKGLTCWPVGEELYAVEDGAIWLVARGRGAAITRLSPTKLVQLEIKTGDWWKAEADGETTTTTCLGTREVGTDAGKFRAQCVVSAAVRAADPAWQRQVFRFYAPGVGLVRETITEETARVGGKSVVETTRELVGFIDDSHRPTTTSVRPARAVGAERLRGVLLDSSERPIVQATVTLRRTDREEAVRLQTDLDGRFRHDGMDPLGKYILVVRLSGFLPEERPLHSPDGATIELEIRLRAAAAQTQPSPGAAASDWFRAIHFSAATTQASKVDRLIEEGRALAAKGEHAAAAEQFGAAIAEDPADMRPRSYLIASLIAQNKLADADAQVADALKRGRDWRIVEMAGQLAISRGKIDTGERLYAEAAGLSPRDAGVVYADLAAALSAANDPRLAGRIEAALKSAAGADPPHLDSLFNLGQSYASAGKQDGRRFLQRYLDEQGKLPEAARDARKMRLARQMIKALDAVRDVGGD